MSEAKERRSAAAAFRTVHLLPSWQVNLALFGVLVLLVVAALFWQLGSVRKGFNQHAQEQARLVAGVIEENLSTSRLAQQTLNDILRLFLGNSASFVAYLDGVEPFNAEELAAYAAEAGLAGLRIVRNTTTVEGPPGWLPLPPGCPEPEQGLHELSGQRLVFLRLPLPAGQGEGCVMVGLDAVRFNAMRERMGLPVLLDSLGRLGGIRYVRLDPRPDDREQAEESVRLLTRDDGLVAECRLPVEGGLLVVGLDARSYLQRVRIIQRQFLIFAGILATLGLIFSWLLSRHRAAELERTRLFERLMAQQHEEAALGRATATIAHEVRNPLNALDIGLQRLQLESDNLSNEQEELLRAMREAVRRTSDIVGSLRRFTQPPRPERTPVRLGALVRESLALYDELCRRQGVTVRHELNWDGELSLDRHLMAEALENLVKNAVEAQPEGGWLRVTLMRAQEEVVLQLDNGGFDVDAEMTSRLGEPYQSTKIWGSGLGLALCRRIVEAHGGRLQLVPDSTQHLFSVRVHLPCGEGVS